MFCCRLWMCAPHLSFHRMQLQMYSWLSSHAYLPALQPGSHNSYMSCCQVVCCKLGIWRPGGDLSTLLHFAALASPHAITALPRSGKSIS